MPPSLQMLQQRAPPRSACRLPDPPVCPSGGRPAPAAADSAWGRRLRAKRQPACAPGPDNPSPAPSCVPPSTTQITPGKCPKPLGLGRGLVGPPLLKGGPLSYLPPAPVPGRRSGLNVRREIAGQESVGMFSTWLHTEMPCPYIHIHREAEYVCLHVCTYLLIFNPP